MIRLLILSDVRLYREGLALILGREPRVAVVDTAATVDAALGRLRGPDLDLVLIDMAMPDSPVAVRVITAMASRVRVVALGVYEVEHELIAYAEAGIAGYVSREASVAELVAALESVARGELLCSPRTAAALLRRVTALAAGREASAGDVSLEALTPREREIAGHLDAGLSNKDIARRLGIEVATVKNHVHNLLEKLRVHRRSQAAARLRSIGPRFTAGDVAARRHPTPVP